MAKKQKYYVVWVGKEPGIYTSWDECAKMVKGVEGAKYKSFESRSDAEEAYQSAPPTYAARRGSATKSSPLLCVNSLGMTELTVAAKSYAGPLPELNSLAVDAACSGNPGVMEYQGVHVLTRQRLFHYKAPVGTNNVGEFLGIVHGLSYLKKQKMEHAVLYSDSVNAISWVRQKLCKSKLPLTAHTAELWDYVHRAEGWLRANTWTTEIRKWDTDNWGEIPADFGRK